MSEVKITKRAEWVESEFKKWQEKFIIPFEQEFNVKTLLNLRHQLETTPDDHIRAKIDLLNAMDRIQQNLLRELKRKKHTEKIHKVLIIAKNKFHLMELRETLEHLLNGVIVNTTASDNHAKFYTSNSTVEIIIPSLSHRGKRVDVYLNLSDDQEFEEKILRPMLRNRD